MATALCTQFSLDFYFCVKIHSLPPTHDFVFSAHVLLPFEVFYFNTPQKSVSCLNICSVCFTHNISAWFGPLYLYQASAYDITTAITLCTARYSSLFDKNHCFFCLLSRVDDDKASELSLEILMHIFLTGDEG